jgi:NADPH:quinone reductase-like Zn-dependent oxidoreductase
MTTTSILRGLAAQMKAVVYHQYGNWEQLQFKSDVAKPQPENDEVLIRVRAVSLNHSDWEFLTGSPAYVRMWGLRRPSRPILGTDVSGEIEAVGPKVTKFKVGDSVFGDIMWNKRGGALAEYVCAPEQMLTTKPTSLSFEEAAALPQAGLVALQALQQAKIRPGDRVAINGAGGGAGTYAIQLARHFGAGEIIAVDTSAKAETMKSLGATETVDYTKQDFTKMNADTKPYDIIIDLVGYHTVGDYQNALRQQGRYVLVGGQVSLLLKTLAWSKWIYWRTGKQMSILAHEPNKDMQALIDHVAQGHIKPVVDKVHKISEIKEAMRYLGEGLPRGKVVVVAE